MERLQKKEEQKATGGIGMLQMAKVMGNQAAIVQRIPVIQMAKLSEFDEINKVFVVNALSNAVKQLNEAKSSLETYESKNRRVETEKVKKYIEATIAILKKDDLAIHKTDVPNTYAFTCEGEMYLNISKGINIKTIIHEAFHLAGYDVSGAESACDCGGKEALGRLLDGDNPNADTFAQFVLRCSEINNN